MIRIAFAFMMMSSSAFAQTAVQGAPQYKIPRCHEEGNLAVCDLNLITPVDAASSTNVGTIQPLEGIPLDQTPQIMAACAALTPSGKCVQIKVDEDGRVIVAPDNKSDADKKCPDTFKEYAEGFKKGYIKALEDQREAK